MRGLVFFLVCLLGTMSGGNARDEGPYAGGDSPVPGDAPDRAGQALARVRPLLEPEMSRLGVGWGDPVFLRIFKESGELELWMEPEPGQPFVRLRNYRVAALSGGLGPKLAEGDGQAPEGCYEVKPGALNPRSRFHLSFNVGYPNAYDIARDRTGSFIMVHGARVSIGCFAMTDDSIEQIYSLVSAALERGQMAVPVHSFPFRMTDERMDAGSGSPWYPFWTELRAVYLAFELNRRPPQVEVGPGAYRVR